PELLVFDGSPASPQLFRTKISLWDVVTGDESTDWDGPIQLQPTKAIVDATNTYLLTTTDINPAAPPPENVAPQIALWDMSEDEGILLLDIQPGYALHDAQFVPDADGLQVIGGGPNGALLWDMEAGEIIQQYDAEVAVETLALSADKRTLFGVTSNGTLLVWDFETTDLQTTYDLGSTAQPIALLPGRPWLVTGQGNSDVVIWDYERQAVVTELTAHFARLSAIEAIPTNDDTLSFITSDYGGRTLIWRGSDTFEITEEFVAEDRLVDILVDVDHRLLALVPTAGDVRVRRIDTIAGDVRAFATANREIDPVTLEDCFRYNVSDICLAVGDASEVIALR
ncbi:MAG: hypothetical protein AAF125_23670, partial [Chloroflexota bacterium]